MSMFEPYRRMLRDVHTVGVCGRVSAVRGAVVSATDFPAPVGAGCRIGCEGSAVEARVVGFVDGRALVKPHGTSEGIRPGDRVCLMPLARRQDEDRPQQAAEEQRASMRKEP